MAARRRAGGKAVPLAKLGVDQQRVSTSSAVRRACGEGRYRGRRERVKAYLFIVELPSFSLRKDRFARPSNAFPRLSVPHFYFHHPFTFMLIV